MRTHVLRIEVLAEAAEHVRILIVDDDASLRSLMRASLTEHGCRVFEAEGGAAMRTALKQETIDVVVLHVMMPGEDGLSLARTLSADRDVGIIMISALGGETDRIIGIDVGADDYLPKPVSPRELLARIRAVMRRRRAGEKTDDRNATYNFNGWQFDEIRRVLRDPDGIIISLSEGEFALLRVFTEWPQRVLTRDQLLEYGRGPDSDSFDRAIDTQVSRLRRKLGGRGAADFIHTVRNEGYMFMPKVSRRW